jgi:glycosyltransferase involved in cell wall biosynthesis
VYTAHGLLHSTDASTLRDRTLDRVERLLSRLTDAILFQSQEDYAHAEATGYRGELVHLGNGVGDEWFEVRPRPRVAGPLHALYVGRLVREKGVLELLEASRLVPEVRLTLVGDSLPSDRDSVVDEVEKAAATSGGRIRKLGMLPTAAVREQMADVDLLVLPSWREGVPRSVIEGMASGLPVIATDIRGCRELVSPGHNGWIVPARDAAALANALEEAAALPAERLAALGAAGRQRAWERHRESLVFERIEATYGKLGVTP